MSLYALGKLSGLVIDCGNRQQIVPVLDGIPVESAKYQISSCGDLTDYLARLMTERGYFFTRYRIGTN